MVEQYKPKIFNSLLSFIKENISEDFYFTENNSRIIIKDENSLKKLLKSCSNINIIEEKGDVLGVIMIWKSVGNNLTRYYIKLNAINDSIADKLISVLLWSKKNDLFVKIRKSSKFYKIFRNNYFNFLGDRGNEVLLVSNKYRNNNDNNHSKSQKSNTR